jgi:hypothetical protein
MPASRFCIVIDNLASATRSADIRHECERAGRVREVVRDARARAALVEFDRCARRLGEGRRNRKLC